MTQKIISNGALAKKLHKFQLENKIKLLKSVLDKPEYKRNDILNQIKELEEELNNSL